MLNNSPNKKFQAGVNRMIVHRSVVTSRFNQKTATGKRKLTGRTATKVVNIDSVTEIRDPNICTPSESAQEKVILELPIACPVPREENNLPPVLTKEPTKEPSAKTPFFSKLFNLDSEDP